VNTGELSLALWGCVTGAENEGDFLPDWSAITSGYCAFDGTLRYRGSFIWRDGQLWNTLARWGQRFDPSGSFLLQPLTNGLDIVDKNTLLLVDRIAFNFSIADVTDAMLVTPDTHQALIITSNGVAVLDLAALPLGVGSVTPSTGPAGTVVQIKGTSFSAGTTVKFDDASALVNLVDSHTLEVTAPAHGDGPARVTITATSGTYSIDAAFTYATSTSAVPPMSARRGFAFFQRPAVIQAPPGPRKQLPHKTRQRQ